jgi:hypothetical protein
MKHALRRLVLLALVAPLLSCSSTSGPDEFEYTERTTPENTLARLVEAYEKMDADVYLDGLADEFIFFLSEEACGADPTLPEYWGRQEEQVIHENMFGHESPVESVSLVLTQVGDPIEIPGPVPEDPSAWQYSMNVDLTVETGDRIMFHAGVGAIFLIQIDDEASAGGRELWEVVEWQEVHEFSRNPRAETSWGGLKHIFLHGYNVPPEYPDRTTPGGVIEKLRLAYVSMDAAAYLDCLAGDFVFHTAEEDQNDPQNPLPETWGWSDEYTIHGNMFGPGTDVDRIILALTNEDVTHDPGTDPEDPSDDTYEYLVSSDLRVYIPITGDDLILLATSDQRFLLRVDPDEQGAGGATLWEIVEWRDDVYYGSKRSEEQTWGAIKGLFR